MKLDTPVPFEKLLWFQEKLGLKEEDLRKIQEYKEHFTLKKEQFGDSQYHFFYTIEESRFILEHERFKGFLRQKWTQWFELLFTEGFSHEILGYLWKSGLRHVEVNIDKRFINLGYARVRQFCQEIIVKEIPSKDRDYVLSVTDKMVDFCVLIETYAYVTATSQCDMEVVRGISHQVRNPLMVIGGNITRLQRNVNPGSEAHMAYATILEENKRLEAMVRDVTLYSEMYQNQPSFTPVSLTEVISNALIKLEGTHSLEKVHIDLNLDLNLPKVHGDPVDLVTMFYYLLQNRLEDIDPENPCIRISCELPEKNTGFIKVEIFNTGKHPNPEEISNLFVPFYSVKPSTTGFALPIAQLAARKNLGEITIEPTEGSGIRCIVRLPIAVESMNA